MLTLQNYINGKWVDSKAGEYWDVVNPASQEVMAKVPGGAAADVDAAATAAAAGFKEWKRITPGKRIQYLFHLKRSEAIA